MRHLMLQTPRRIAFFAVLCILTGFLLYMSEFSLVAIPTLFLVFDGLIQTLIFAFLAYILWFVIEFAESTNTQFLQRILNQVAILAIMYPLWIGIPLLIENIFWDAYFSEFLKLIALKSVFGLLTLTLMSFYYKGIKRDSKMALEEDDDDSEENVVVVEELPVKKQISTISVKSGQKIHMIGLSEILYLMADGDYVLIHTCDGKYLKEQTMKFFDEHLPSDMFIRIHRSCIVHVAFISRIELYEKQNYRITLKTGQQLKASQAGYKLLKQTLKL